MKRMLAGALVVALSTALAPELSAGSVAHAEEVYVVPPPPPPYHREWRARRMRNAGVALSIIGTALVVSGSIVAAAGPSYYDSRNGDWNTGTAIGASMAIPGTVLLTAGIPMWVVGESESRRPVRQFSLAPTNAAVRF